MGTIRSRTTQRDWNKNHHCQWKQEGKSKFVPEHIHGHDKRKHNQCQKYFAPIKQKSRIFIFKLSLPTVEPDEESLIYVRITL